MASDGRARSQRGMAAVGLLALVSVALLIFLGVSSLARFTGAKLGEQSRAVAAIGGPSRGDLSPSIPPPAGAVSGDSNLIEIGSAFGAAAGTTVYEGLRGLSDQVNPLSENFLGAELNRAGLALANLVISPREQLAREAAALQRMWSGLKGLALHSRETLAEGSGPERAALAGLVVGLVINPIPQGKVAGAVSAVGRVARGGHAARRLGRDPLEEALAHGRVISARSNGKPGVNASEIWKVQGPQGEIKGIYKSAAGESGFSLQGSLGGIRRGTKYVREVAAYRLDRALNLGLVPTTVVREVDGTPGSLQAFVKGAVDLDKIPRQSLRFDRVATEKLRVFDYLIGNGDRHWGNVMARPEGGRHIPVLIDNGLAFPTGPPRVFRNSTRYFSEFTGPLQGETRAFIQGIDPTEVARVLADSGLEKEATIGVLRRLARLKGDPSFLEIPEGALGSTRMNLRTWTAQQGRNQTLPPAARQAIDRLADEAYGR